jgi:hypothetical protein
VTTLQVSPPLRARVQAADAPARHGRTLSGYLLLPRPKDLVKAVIVPLSFAVGAAAQGRVSTTALWRAAVVWAVLELLVYQARYQWNDVRGFAADQAHPEGADRGRLPGPIEKRRAHIAASLTVAGLRLAATGAVALAVPGLRGLLLAMTIGVFGVAFVYEHVRSLATGSTAEVPVPLHPSLIGLWVAVGAGYAVRGLTGLALALSLTGRPALVVASAVTMWSLGVVFVTCRWALEAMCFASFSGDRVVWDATAAKAREHTLGLVRWLPSTSGARVPAQWRALEGRTSLTAPWNLALLLAAAAAAVTGRLLVGTTSVPTAVALGGAGAVVAVVSAGLSRSRGVAAVGSSVALAAAEGLAGLSHAAVAVLPLLVVLVAYACFTHQCASEIGRPLRRLEPLLHR